MLASLYESISVPGIAGFDGMSAEKAVGYTVVCVVVMA